MSVIQSIGPEPAQFVVASAGAAPEPPSQRATVAAPDGSREYVVKLSDEAVDIASLQGEKNGLNEAAKGVRSADQSMRQMLDYIDRMKSDLNAITKQYPPYPPGSEDRVRFLKSFSAFRRQIEKLTVPSPPEEGGAAGK